MSHIALSVSGSLLQELSYEITCEGVESTMHSMKSDLSAEDLLEQPGRFQELLPATLTQEIRQYVLNSREEPLLVIESSKTKLDCLPWECLPALLELPTLFVVRSLARPPGSISKGDSPTRLLGVGWSGKPYLELPGIQDELSALSHLESVGGIQVRAISDPTAIQFANEYTNYQPSLLHLAFIGVEYNDAVPKVYVTSGGETNPVAVDELLSALPGAVQAKLAVLNCCDGGASVHGPAALRVFAESLNTVAIGWLRKIDDRTAVDFARFFYSRLLDGDTVLDALVRYRALGPQLNIYEQAHRGNGGPPRPHTLNTEAVSVIWTPSLELIRTPVLKTAEQDEAGSGATPANNLRSGTRRHQTTVTESPSSRVKSDPDVATATPVSIELDFEPQKWLNPALLKNGRPAILRLGLSADRPLSPVGLCIRCDTGDGVSSVRQTLMLEKGFQPVPANAIQFPVLYHLIEAGIPRRQVNFTVSCTHKGELLAEVTRSVLWMGQTEWLDKPDTWHFVPAFVNPNANKVLDVIDEADNLLRQIAEPTSAFSSYQTGDVEFVFKQVEAIFNCLRGDPFNLKYIAPPPLGVYIPGDQHTSGQRVRMPAEVIKRKRGTCHDLSILFASCLEQIQIYPLIILIRGHTFVGFWLDHNAHRDFWRHAMKDQQRRPQSPGRDWTITNFEEIRSLLESKSLAMLEVTKVTDRNASFSKALVIGRENLEEEDPPEEWFDVAIDIQASRQQINPL